ncbi:hypothetical protein GQ42DRAFT_83555 [Ramicandelaber brevisporus]|nr:hypothetical protein GQ42DRAFT_83555 [Ramicandelaber brevisporus]
MTSKRPPIIAYGTPRSAQRVSATVGSGRSGVSMQPPPFTLAEPKTRPALLLDSDSDSDQGLTANRSTAASTTATATATAAPSTGKKKQAKLSFSAKTIASSKRDSATAFGSTEDDTDQRSTSFSTPVKRRPIAASSPLMRCYDSNDAAGGDNSDNDNDNDNDISEFSIVSKRSADDSIKPATLEQLYLDVHSLSSNGRRSGYPSTCEGCGMTYQRGVPSDESLHTKFHRSWQVKSRLSSGDDGKTVGTLSEPDQDNAAELVRIPVHTEQQVTVGSLTITRPVSSHITSTASTSTQLTLFGKPIASNGHGRGRSVSTSSPISTVDIVMIAVNNRTPLRILRKAGEVLDMANAELGSVVFDVTRELTGDMKLYLALTKTTRKAVGCVLVERLDRATHSISETMSSNSSPCPAATTTVGPSTPFPVCGIARIWVAGQVRRCKLATLMVDNILRHFVYGMTLQRDQLAFSQLTMKGSAFSQAYMQGKHVTVYTNT